MYMQFIIHVICTLEVIVLCDWKALQNNSNASICRALYKSVKAKYNIYICYL